MNKTIDISFEDAKSFLKEKGYTGLGSQTQIPKLIVQYTLLKLHDYNVLLNELSEEIDQLKIKNENLEEDNRQLLINVLDAKLEMVDPIEFLKFFLKKTDPRWQTEDPHFDEEAAKLKKEYIKTLTPNENENPSGH